MIDFNRAESYSDQEVKRLALRGIIWRDRYFWNGKLEKTGNCGMYRCFSKRGNIIHFNRWTPEYSC